MTNTGTVAGAEVVQAYLSLPASASAVGAAQPPKRLVGFQKVELAPGASKEVVIIDRSRRQPPSAERVEHGRQQWVTPAGQYTVHVGRSSSPQDLVEAGLSAAERRTVMASYAVRTSIAPVGLLVTLLSITENTEMKYRGPQRNAFEFLLQFSVALGCLPSVFSVIESSLSRRTVLACAAPPASSLSVGMFGGLVNICGSGHQVALEERERALPGQLGGGRVVARRGVVVEAVLRAGVQVHLVPDVRRLQRRFVRRPAPR